jgi:hypothetical protein
MSDWLVLPHREVKKSDIPLLEKAGLKQDFDEIIVQLKKNPISACAIWSYSSQSNVRFIPCG